MAFEGQNGGSGIKLYTGVSQWDVVAMNPTAAELTKLSGREVTEEPAYVKDAGAEKQVKIEFWLKNPIAGTQRLSFFLENKDRINKDSNKFEFVNKFGQATWGATVDECTTKTGANGNVWFKAEGARKAKVGEAKLIEFLFSWLHIKITKGGDRGACYIEDVDKLFNGDFSELKPLVELNKDKKIYILSGVKDVDGKKYHAFYNLAFTRGTSSIDQAHRVIGKKLTDPYSEFKADYQNDLKFQEWQPNTTITNGVDDPEKFNGDLPF